MIKKYAVVTSPMNPAQEGKFALNLSGLEWWHYIPGFWLIVDSKEKIDAIKIREMVQAIDPNLDCAVFPVEALPKWATRLGTEVNKASRDWLNSNWYVRNSE